MTVRPAGHILVVISGRPHWAKLEARTENKEQMPCLSLRNLLENSTYNTIILEQWGARMKGGGNLFSTVSNDRLQYWYY